MSPTLHRQQGATLIIALIMLVMVTLIVVSAMSLSLTNLRMAGNMQYRTEAQAAAGLAIEQVITTNFLSTPTTVNVDANRDGTTDYTVIVTPTCASIRLTPTSELVLPADIACVAGSGMGLGAGQSLCADTTWDVVATVQDGDNGAVVTLHQGIRKRMEFTLAQGECS